MKPTRRRKTFEKCGEGIPREVQAKPARSAGMASDKSRRGRRERFRRSYNASRDGVILLVAKQPFSSQSDTSRRFDGVTMLLVTKSLLSLLSNTSRRVATLPTHLTLLVAKQHFSSQRDTSRRIATLLGSPSTPRQERSMQLCYL